MRVLSIPAAHDYVRHLAPVRRGTGSVVVLPDPPPRSDGTDGPLPGRWWPPAALDPAWVDEHHEAVDVVHLHFGFDASSPDELRAWVAALRRTRIPLLFTVHDLRNPHHEDRALHDAQLDVLVPAADALVTLTPGAAAEVRRRWGREALVLPHPHVVPLETMSLIRSARAFRQQAPTFVVGVHLKSLRASSAPRRVLPTLVDTLVDLPHSVLRVHLHREVLDPGHPRHDGGLLADLHAWAEADLIDLRMHDRLDDDALFASLAELDLCVLPYRFGTHSGWLEACRDVGTTVVAPTCGYLSEQGPVLTYMHEEAAYDAASLAAAVRRAWRLRPQWGAHPSERARQRAALATAHQALYRELTEAGE